MPQPRMGSTSDKAIDGSFQRTLRATHDSIAGAAEDLAAWLDAARLPEPAALLARLALDELAANVAMHGAGTARELRIACRRTAAELVVQVEDDGPAFDPRTVPSPDLGVPAEHRPTGGLGIHLLRELSDRFDYVREDGRNRVTLRRRVDG